MAKKKKTKKKAKSKAKKNEKKTEKPVEEVKEEEVQEEEVKEEVEKEEEKPSEEVIESSTSVEETKSEKRMRLSILLLSMVCALLWGALLYLLNQTYMINDNYQELIMKVDTLTTLYEKDNDVEEVEDDKDATDDSDMDEEVDDSEDTDEPDGDEEANLMERTFECDHPYSDGEGPTGSMTLRYPEGVTITDSSPVSMPYACMLELSYMSGTLYLKYSNGEAYPKQLDADIVELKTVGEDILARGPLQFYPESDIYAEAGYRTSYDMRSPDSECVDSEIWGPMEPPCGIPGNQFLTFLGSSYVVIDEGTSESERAQIVEVFDTINIESEGGPYDE